MNYQKTPKFIIKRAMQKSSQTGLYFDRLVTENVMRQICIELTGQEDYEAEFVENDYKDEFLDAKYNQGRLAILQYQNMVFFISFSDEKCKGRNSGIQSVPTAFNRFYANPHEEKELYFYFLPCAGNNATSYHLFMYRLMKTAGFHFMNVPPSLAGRIQEFASIDDIIRARRENREKNSGNRAAYIVKNAPHEYEIFGKTYGANKYATSLICYAMSRLADIHDHITLYEYNEKDLKELPKASLSVIRSMGNINIVNIDDEIEKREFETNNSLRSPRFQAHLLDRLGEKHCVLCHCGISEIIQGAHILPVASIKRMSALSEEEKLEYAADGENGLWMCQNHHKLFDSNILKLSDMGGVSYKEGLPEEDLKYMKSMTTVSRLPHRLVTSKFKGYINRRNEIYGL